MGPRSMKSGKPLKPAQKRKPGAAGDADHVDFQFRRFNTFVSAGFDTEPSARSEPVGIDDGANERRSGAGRVRRVGEDEIERFRLRERKRRI